ncbi:ABC transporter ATP-binding protein [Acidaminobacter sp. JC074]|uniref:ABC transporter ATP-binding protein n=1 Tax=Acidaminobacter sp. JC074 TaxID=2530199 RepID=UPI001F0F08F2|nr:ABC transporter ATP-binding protein [Acidaminobacter sp. JC074]MCH4890080.1 ABC transporter ATP-binding protein [Acidaminobacter sp. JC074]
MNKAKYGVFSNILYIIRNVWRVDRILLLAMIASVIATVVQPIIIIYMPKFIIQFFEEARPVADLMRLVVYFGVISLIIGSIKSFADGYLPRKIAYFRSMKLGSEMALASLNVHYKYLSSDNGQQEIRKARQAMSRGNIGIQDMANKLILCTANLIGAIVYIFILSALNPLVIIALISCGLLSYLAGNRVNKYRLKTKDDISKVERKRHYINDSTRDVKFAKDIRLYGMFEWLVSLGDKFISEENEWYKKITTKVFKNTIIDGLIAFFRDGFAYIYLINLVLTDQIAVSEFTLYIGSIAGFSLWISRLVNNTIILNADSLQVSDFRVFMDRADDNIKNRLPEKEIKTPISIELKDVNFSYNDHVIYKDFNLKIEAGKKIALVGINGAGKSTLVKLILNLIEADSGQILINGIDSREIDMLQYYDLFSVAFQDALILAYGIDVNVSMTSSDQTDQEKVDHVLKLSGLDEKVKSLKNGKYTSAERYLDSDGTELSGGERQKLILARALYKDAPVLILDEPSSALDPIAEAELYEKYHDMTKDKTAIYISHRLSSTKFCDEVLLLDEGQIIERGSHKDLMALDGKYAEMFNVQSHYYHKEVEVIS